MAVLHGPVKPGGNFIVISPRVFLGQVGFDTKYSPCSAHPLNSAYSADWMWCAMTGSLVRLFDSAPWYAPLNNLYLKRVVEEAPNINSCSPECFPQVPRASDLKFKGGSLPWVTFDRTSLCGLLSCLTSNQEQELMNGYHHISTAYFRRDGASCR